MSESTTTSSTSLMSFKVLVLAGIFLIIVIIIVLLIFLCFRGSRKKRKLLPKLHSSGSTPLVSKEISMVKEIDLTPSSEKQTRIEIIEDHDEVGPKKEAEIKVDIGGVRKGDGGGHISEDPNIGWGRWYSLKEVEMATRGFEEGNVIGEGGYGVVYRGVLQDGCVVAVKNLHNNKYVMLLS